MRVIQNPKRKNVGYACYKRPSRVVVYDDRAEVEVFGDAEPHLVDVERAEVVANHRWSRNGCGYAHASIDRRMVYLHRFVLGPVPVGLEVDHIDRNTRDNRAENLRLATHAENLRNMARRRDNTSGTSGVSWREKYKTWRAYITVNGKQRHLGSFDDFNDAVAARKAAEAELFGAFAPHGFTT